MAKKAKFSIPKNWKDPDLEELRRVPTNASIGDLYQTMNDMLEDQVMRVSRSALTNCLKGKTRSPHFRTVRAAAAAKGMKWTLQRVGDVVEKPRAMVIPFNPIPKKGRASKIRTAVAAAARRRG